MKEYEDKLELYDKPEYDVMGAQRLFYINKNKKTVECYSDKGFLNVDLLPNLTTEDITKFKNFLKQTIPQGCHQYTHIQYVYRGKETGLFAGIVFNNYT